MKKILVLLSMLVCLFVMVGCGSETSLAPAKKNENLLTTPNAVANAMQELQNMDGLKGKDIRIFQDLYVSSTHIDASIVKPGTDKVDAYSYHNGKWSKPEPVQLSGDGSVEENSVPISDYDFTKIPDMIKIVDQKVKEVKIEDPEPIKSIIYIYNPLFGTREVSIPVNGSREKYAAEFTYKGEFVKFEKR